MFGLEIDAIDLEETLQALGSQVLYTEEDANGSVVIVVEKLPKKNVPFIKKMIPIATDIDWHQQWQLHAKHYTDGKIQLDLGQAEPLKIYPGPGFGDLSHPTTELVLKLMRPHVPNKTVVDIGSGSGILTLAALHMGAKRAIGIEICEKALEHAKKNAAHNSLDTFFCHPEKYKEPNEPYIALMNMITSEQVQAFHPGSHLETLIASGIQVQELDAYKKWLQTFGLTVTEVKVDGDWAAVVAILKKTLQV